MKDVTKRLQRMLTELESIESEMQQANLRKSQTDLNEQKILHTIEKETFDMERGNYLLKELRRTRKERRKAKDDHAVLQSVMHGLNGVRKKIELSIGNVNGVIERQRERKITEGY